jgi:tRNA(fMet)-specific endonuclease VapC
MYLLDTDHCVHLLRRKPGHQALRDKLKTLDPGDVCLSVITEAELRTGADKSSDPGKNHDLVSALLAMIPSKPFDSSAALKYGKIRSYLGHSGQGIGPNDTLVAAHALSLDAVLASRNLSKFQRVPELAVVNWIPDL